MKILFPIIAFYPSQKAGPSIAIAWMVKALNIAGIETTVVTTNLDVVGDIQTDMWQKNEYGRIIYHSYFLAIFPVKAILCSIREIRKNDIIHLNYIYNPFDFIIAICCLFFRKHVVWAPSGMLDKKALRYKKVKKSIYLFFFKAIFKGRICFHSSSPHESADIKRIFGNDSRIIEYPNFIELPRMENRPIKSVFLFVGRIDPIKAIDNLILAINQSVLIRQSKFMFYIVGDINNGYGRKLKRMVKELKLTAKICFLGHKENEEKYRLFSSAYFLILPSHSENFGNVVTESLSQGTPVIASEGTPWKILEDNNSGFWCNNSPEALAATIEKAIQMQVSRYLQFRENALATAKKYYCISSNISKWIQAYENLLDNESNRKFSSLNYGGGGYAMRP